VCFLHFAVRALLSVLTFLPSVVNAEEIKAPQVEYSTIHAASGGVNAFVPGKWGLLNLEVVNPLQESHELLSTTYFEGEPTLQFGRRIWVPARSRLRTWQPVLLPRVSSQAGDRFEFHSLVLDVAAGKEVATRDDTGQVLHSGILPAQLENPITGLLESLDESQLRDTEGSSAYELVIASRLSQRLSTRLAALRDPNFAPDDVSLQSLHQLVVTDNRAIADPAGAAAIRRWVHGGGWLWVMLDRVDPQVLERILGDEFECAMVDRVGLTTVRIERSGGDRRDAPAESEYEQPVALVRVLVNGADVRYRVNGWPAAFWKSFGAGKVLATTLAPRGWMRLKTAEDARSQNSGRPVAPEPDPTAKPAGWSRFVPLPPMADTAKEFFQSRSAAPEIAPLLEPQASEYIGYSIPSRQLVASLLGGFVTTVVILGIWLLRKSALEHLGWISPGLAIGFAAVLLVIGGLNRHIVPATAAAVEVIEAIPGTDDIRSRGAVAFYNPESAPGAIGSVRGGRLMPDMAGLAGTTRRMVWKDLDTWNWEHLAFGGGQRLGKFMESETLSDRIEAHGTFGPEGLSGKLSVAGLADRADALVATRMGRVGVELQPNDGFRAAAANAFTADQYLGAGLVSDEQDRRRRTYAHVLPELMRERSAGDPLLFLWARRRDTGFQFDEGRRLRGASLVAIALKIDRPPAQTHVRISAPFLPFRNLPQLDGTPSSPLWDHHRLEWLERSTPSTAWLRFQLPASLLPLELSRAQLVITVTGPVGRVEISALRRRPDNLAPGGEAAAAGRDEVVSVKTYNAPVGTLPVAEILDSDLLRLDSTGGFVLGLAVGNPHQPPPTPKPGSDDAKVSFWKIEHLSLELWGTVSP
jgi:hypothetical protein